MIKNLIIFATGATLGGVGTWLYSKYYYEKRESDSIESLTRYYEERVNTLKTIVNDEANTEIKEATPEEKAKISKNKPDLAKYTEILEKKNYNSYSDKNKKKEEKMRGPYVITPDEWAEQSSFEEVQLYFFQEDEVLSTIAYETVDIDSTVGKDALTHFGEFEQDIVYVMNEKLSIKYEVILQEGSYESIAAGDTYYDADEEY